MTTAFIAPMIWTRTATDRPRVFRYTAERYTIAKNGLGRWQLTIDTDCEIGTFRTLADAKNAADQDVRRRTDNPDADTVVIVDEYDRPVLVDVEPEPAKVAPRRRITTEAKPNPAATGTLPIFCPMCGIESELDATQCDRCGRGRSYTRTAEPQDDAPVTHTLIVVPCAAAKLSEPAAARDLYSSPNFRHTLAAFDRLSTAPAGTIAVHGWNQYRKRDRGDWIEVASGPLRFTSAELATIGADVDDQDDAPEDGSLPLDLPAPKSRREHVREAETAQLEAVAAAVHAENVARDANRPRAAELAEHHALIAGRAAHTARVAATAAKDPAATEAAESAEHHARRAREHADAAHANACDTCHARAARRVDAEHAELGRTFAYPAIRSLAIRRMLAEDTAVRCRAHNPDAPDGMDPETDEPLPLDGPAGTGKGEPDAPRPAARHDERSRTDADDDGRTTRSDRADTGVGAREPRAPRPSGPARGRPGRRDPRRDRSRCVVAGHHERGRNLEAACLPDPRPETMKGTEQ